MFVRFLWRRHVIRSTHATHSLLLFICFYSYLSTRCANHIHYTLVYNMSRSIPFLTSQILTSALDRYSLQFSSHLADSYIVTIPRAYAPAASDRAFWIGLDWSRMSGTLGAPTFLSDGPSTRYMWHVSRLGIHHSFYILVLVITSLLYVQFHPTLTFYF